MSKQNLDELIEASEEAISKGEDLSEIEAEHHHKVKVEHKSKEEKIAEKIKEKRFNAEDKQDKQDKQDNSDNRDNKAKPDNQVEKNEKLEDKTAETSEEKLEQKEEKKSKKVKRGKAKVRSKSYIAAKEQVDPKEKYEIKEAIELTKKTSMTKFDGNIEVHFRILGKSGKPEQVRGLIKYPFATGKSVKVEILDEKMIEEIAKTSKADADIYLTTPEMMPQVAKLAKILGPKGKMPNPKAGTITKDPEATKKDMEGGQTEYKTDSYGIIHQIIGKVSGKTEELEENYKTILDVLPLEKIVSINIAATMGPGIKVKK